MRTDAFAAIVKTQSLLTDARIEYFNKTFPIVRWEGDKSLEFVKVIWETPDNSEIIMIKNQKAISFVVGE